MASVPESSIRYEREGPVVRLCLSRPARRNAADRAMIEALDAALDRAEADADARVIQLTGDGDGFCAGWDVDDIVALGDLSEPALAAAFERNAEVLRRLQRLGRPTIALVNGPVAGFGMSLVARCDFAIASDRATFHLPETAIGLVPAVVADDMLRVMGARAAFDWLSLADRRDARTALAAGLVRSVVPDVDLRSEGDRLALQLAGMSPAVLAELKGLLRRMEQGDPDTRHGLAVTGAVAAIRSDAARALLEKSRRR